jgi:hypothetical protein
MPINVNRGESESEFISRCIGEEVSSGKEQSQAAAICYSYWDKENMSKITDTAKKVMARVNYDTKFRGINLMADSLEDACWDGYIAVGLKPMGDRMVPNCVPEGENMQEEGMEIDVLGYKTKNFTLCPGAVATFNHLMEMPLDEDTIGMVRSAAQVADNVFRIEKEVIQKGSATEEELKEAMILVGDFKDIMEEIDEEVMMQHDVSYMDGHIAKIESYL